MPNKNFSKKQYKKKAGFRSLKKKYRKKSRKKKPVKRRKSFKYYSGGSKFPNPYTEPIHEVDELLKFITILEDKIKELRIKIEYQQQYQYIPPNLENIKWSTNIPAPTGNFDNRTGMPIYGVAGGWVDSSEKHIPVSDIIRLPIYYIKAAQIEWEDKTVIMPKLDKLSATILQWFSQIRSYIDKHFDGAGPLPSGQQYPLPWRQLKPQIWEYYLMWFQSYKRQIEEIEKEIDKQEIEKKELSEKIKVQVGRRRKAEERESIDRVRARKFWNKTKSASAPAPAPAPQIPNKSKDKKQIPLSHPVYL